ncbi:MAG TPA: hypothetical protein VNB22_20355 [Pyrinomonadaceae bacterium]|jgi:hypothetical protein|nr:hypothetical protein [Pyrinomonadaceae bacterium]
MFKKIGVKILVLMMIGVMFTTDSMAQTRVRFAKGRSSATFSGTIRPGSSVRSYVLRAREGQTLTATLSSGNGKCDFTQGDYEDTQYSQVIEEDGDVTFSIDNHGKRATTFTLTISIK